MNVLVENMKSLSIKKQSKSKTQITIANEPPEKSIKKHYPKLFYTVLMMNNKWSKLETNMKKRLNCTLKRYLLVLQIYLNSGSNNQLYIQILQMLPKKYQHYRQLSLNLNAILVVVAEHWNRGDVAYHQKMSIIFYSLK